MQPKPEERSKEGKDPERSSTASGRAEAAREHLAVAVDLPSLEAAELLMERLAGVAGWLKVGSELFTAAGPAALAAARRHGRVFLDTKLHDIPRTVARAVRAAVAHGVDMLTLHASGGRSMLRAAREAAREEAERRSRRPPLLLGVTVLTSLEEPDLAAIGVPAPVEEQVARLTDLVLEAGLDGVVASPREAQAVRRRAGAALRIVTPGVRPEGEPAGDQRRVATIEQAVAAGADVVVIGRPVLGAADPAAAARACLAAIETALAARDA